MGNRLSASRDLYLHEYKNPCIVPFQLAKLYHCRDADLAPFAGIVSETDKHQKAVVTGIYLLFVYNNAHDAVEVRFSGLFDGGTIEGVHPDDANQITIICPPDTNGQVAPIDATLYMPRLREDYIRMYGGLEDVMMQPRTLGDTDVEIVKSDEDPLYRFCLVCATPLKAASNDIFKDDKSGHFHIKKAYLERVRTFFKNTVMDDIRYTRFETVKVECNVPSSEASFIVQINGYLISPTKQPRLEVI